MGSASCCRTRRSRDRGDTSLHVAAVERAKRDGLVFVFISHQWLGFNEPDPDGSIQCGTPPFVVPRHVAFRTALTTRRRGARSASSARRPGCRRPPTTLMNARRLFDEIYRDRNGAKADAWTTIEQASSTRRRSSGRGPRTTSRRALYLGSHPSVHGLARRPGGWLEAGPAWLRAGGSWHAGGAARAFGAGAVETVATPRGVVAAALTARAAPKHVDDTFQGLVAGQLDRAHAYARGALALANLARIGAVDAAAATDGVLPAPGLGGGRRRRRGLSNGVVGGVIPISYYLAACKTLATSQAGFAAARQPHAR